LIPVPADTGRVIDAVQISSSAAINKTLIFFIAFLRLWGDRLWGTVPLSMYRYLVFP